MKPSRLIICMLGIAAGVGTSQAIGQTNSPPSNESAQSTGSQQQTAVFSREELDAMLAPIALYPDALLSQVLMAATYPLEIVQASRWSKANGDKGGESAASMVADQTWDASVKSLVAFPKVLHMMNDQLEWTQKVGDAFLAQQADVMNSIQRLRAQAQKAGNLKSNQQQTVVTQGDSIVIQPAQPQVIYVPAYNPTIVYGTWPYPLYPPTYYPGVASWYPGQSFVNGLMWGTGVVAASAIFGSFNWGSRSVDINVNNYNRYSRNNFYNASNNRWRHDPQHRGAVAYRDQASRQQFSNRIPGAEARQEFRGRGDAQQSPKRDAIHQKAQEHRPATPRGDAFKGVESGRQQIDRGKASVTSANRPHGGVQQAAHRVGGDRPQINRAGGGGGHQINRGGGGGGRAGRHR